MRILPPATPGETVADLIEDPWETFACRGDEAGCTVEFTDTTPARAGREAIYYARAIEKAAPTVNAGNLRCEFNEKGECVSVRPCYGDLRTALQEDCSAKAEERAWSSPIFVRPM